MKKSLYCATVLALSTVFIIPGGALAQSFTKKYPADELLAGAEACSRIALLGLSDIDFNQLKGDRVGNVLMQAVERIGLDPKGCFQSKLNEGQLQIISGNSD